MFPSFFSLKCRKLKSFATALQRARDHRGVGGVQPDGQLRQQERRLRQDHHHQQVRKRLQTFKNSLMLSRLHTGVDFVDIKRIILLDLLEWQHKRLKAKKCKECQVLCFEIKLLCNTPKSGSGLCNE